MRPCGSQACPPPGAGLDRPTDTEDRKGGGCGHRPHPAARPAATRVIQRNGSQMIDFQGQVAVLTGFGIRHRPWRSPRPLAAEGASRGPAGRAPGASGAGRRRGAGPPEARRSASRPTCPTPRPVEAAAEEIVAAFGKVPCAGQQRRGDAARTQGVSRSTTRSGTWILKVNLYGLVHTPAHLRPADRGARRKAVTS